MSTSKRTSNRLSQRSPEPVIDLDTFERERRQRQREQRRSQASEELFGEPMHFTIDSKTEVVPSIIEGEEMKPREVTNVDNVNLSVNVTEDEEGRYSESKDSKFDNDNDILGFIQDNTREVIHPFIHYINNSSSLPDCIRSLFEEVTMKKQVYEDLFNHLKILMQVDNQVLNTIDNHDKKLSKSLQELYQVLVNTTDDLHAKLFERTSDIVAEIISRLPENEDTDISK